MVLLSSNSFSLPLLHLDIIRWKHALDAFELTLPPIICALGLLQDLDLIALLEDQIAVTLTGEIV